MTTSDIRKIGDRRQGVDESISWQCDVGEWTTTPTGPTVKVYDESNGKADVTATVMPAGSASVSSDIIICPPLTALTEGHVYRVEVKFTGPGSNVQECWFLVTAER